MHVKFWGVRGTVPTPQQENLSYGGNTPCVEIRFSDSEVFIIDGGTGIRKLGQELSKAAGDGIISLNIFYTHFHWDHIQGMPFFEPIYSEQNQLNFFAPRDPEQMLDMLMGGAYFPVGVESARAQKEFTRLSRETLKFGEVNITPFSMNHPQGAYGYRIENGNSVVVYASDHEHGLPAFDKSVRDHAEGADVLIYDSQYTPEEYVDHIGWGHSTWTEAISVAEDANVRQLVLFHHEPTHTDEISSAIEAGAAEKRPGTVMAREGMEIEL